VSGIFLRNDLRSREGIQKHGKKGKGTIMFPNSTVGISERNQ
jgi:hypothetical protein